MRAGDRYGVCPLIPAKPESRPKPGWTGQTKEGSYEYEDAESGRAIRARLSVAHLRNCLGFTSPGRRHLQRTGLRRFSKCSHTGGRSDLCVGYRGTAAQWGFQSADFFTLGAPGVLNATLLSASTSGANGVAHSRASLADLVVLPGNAAQVTASFVQAESEATCNGVRGSTEVANATFGGQAIAVDPFAPNQTVGTPNPIGGPPVATLIINEQKTASGGGTQDITVNAVHLTLLTGDEVILSSAHSDVKGCPGCPPTPPCFDFMTGGGWFPVGNNKADFGFNAGYKPGSSTPEIHFNYIDHNSGMQMKATSISVYKTGDTATTRHMEGNAEINGVSGFTYKIDAADNGEPGRHGDSLKSSLSNGYSAGGTLGGGNNQLHKPCP